MSLPGNSEGTRSWQACHSGTPKIRRLLSGIMYMPCMPLKVNDSVISELSCVTTKCNFVFWCSFLDILLDWCILGYSCGTHSQYKCIMVSRLTIQSRGDAADRGLAWLGIIQRDSSQSPLWIHGVLTLVLAQWLWHNYKLVSVSLIKKQLPVAHYSIKYRTVLGYPEIDNSD